MTTTIEHEGKAKNDKKKRKYHLHSIVVPQDNFILRISSQDKEKYNVILYKILLGCQSQKGNIPGKFKRIGTSNGCSYCSGRNSRRRSSIVSTVDDAATMSSQ